MFDYTNPDGVTISVYSHIIELSQQLKSGIAHLSAEEIAENADIIAEYARILDLLVEYDRNERITIFYADGLNCFEIIDN